MQPVIEFYFTELDSYRYFLFTGEYKEPNRWHTFTVSQALINGSMLLVRSREAKERTSFTMERQLQTDWLNYSDHAYHMSQAFLKLVANLAINTEEKVSDGNS